MCADVSTDFVTLSHSHSVGSQHAVKTTSPPRGKDCVTVSRVLLMGDARSNKRKHSLHSPRIERTTPGAPVHGALTA